MERFLDALLKNPVLEGRDLSAIYAALDSRLRLGDKSGARIAALLQGKRSPGMSYPVSAHICALNTLSGKKVQGSLTKEFKSYAEQGFPAIEDEGYAAQLAKSLLNCRLSGDDFEALIGMMASSPVYAHAISREIIGSTTERDSYAWNVLVGTLMQEGHGAATGVLVTELMDAKKSDKQLDQLLGMLHSRKAQDWFYQVVRDIQDERERSAPKSGLGRIFGFGRKKK